MEHTHDQHSAKGKFIYQKLLKIIPNLPEHLQMEIPSLVAQVEGDRDLHYSLGHKESDDVYYITLEQSLQEEDQALVTRMEVRISLSEETALPISYCNQYEDLRIDLDEQANPKPHHEHSAEVHKLFKNWLRSLDYRGYRIEHDNASSHNKAPRQFGRSTIERSPDIER